VNKLKLNFVKLLCMLIISWVECVMNSVLNGTALSCVHTILKYVYFDQHLTWDTCVNHVLSYRGKLYAFNWLKHISHKVLIIIISSICFTESRFLWCSAFIDLRESALIYTHHYYLQKTLKFEISEIHDIFQKAKRLHAKS